MPPRGGRSGVLRPLPALSAHRCAAPAPPNQPSSPSAPPPRRPAAAPRPRRAPCSPPARGSAWRLRGARRRGGAAIPRWSSAAAAPCDPAPRSGYRGEAPWPGGPRRPPCCGSTHAGGSRCSPSYSGQSPSDSRVARVRPPVRPRACRHPPPNSRRASSNSGSPAGRLGVRALLERGRPLRTTGRHRLSRVPPRSASSGRGGARPRRATAPRAPNPRRSAAAPTSHSSPPTLAFSRAALR
mmetsp:Transcript_30305/g.100541  ORF Transcript_30305/g.100541 Transcript_30305/m.100541 type:complete len:240 (+) Transcript_30305:1091-1810(+)